MRALRDLLRRPAGAALLTTTALWFVVWLAFPLAGFWRTAALNVLWTLVATSGALACFAAAREGAELALRRSLILLGAGSLSWALGQAVWTWYTLVPRVEVPYPSVADLGYLPAPLLILAALILWPSQKRKLRRADVFQLVLVVGTTGLFSFSFLVEPVLSAGVSGLAEVLTLSYALSETAVFALLAAGLVSGWTEQRGRSVLVGAGILSLTVADAGFGIDGTGYAAAFEPGWTIPFLLFGIVALAPRSLVRVTQISGWIVPIGLGLLFVGLHAKDAIELGIEDLAMFALLGLLVARYFVLARDERNEARELGRTKAELERAYGDRESALAASRTGLCLFADGQARFWNPAFLELLEIEGHVPTDWASFLARIQTASTLGDEFAFEMGAGKSIRVRLSALGLGEMLVSVDDVTDDVRERATRDEFVAQMVTTQEHDSRRVAELLHEDVVQQLTALGFGLELASMRLEDGSLAELSASVGQIMTSLRRLLVDLHPAVLESQGFAAAVDVAAADLRAAGVEVDVSPFGERFGRTLEQLAYRAVQEAFKNVLAHARAERVAVDIVGRGSVLFCEITDDGRGFGATEPIEGIRSGRLGVKLVRKRIELAGGTFSLRSASGSGTTFAFTLPMDGVPVEPSVHHAEVA